MSLSRVINAKTLADLVRRGVINNEGVRLFDCAFVTAPPPKPDPIEFRQKLYGNFEKIVSLDSPQRRDFLSARIPGAVHANLDAVLFPGKYQRFEMYPPELFEKYIQMLGLNKDEHIILYARGRIGGMLHAYKMAWLLKSYGHSPDKMSILNGGFDYWRKQGYEVDASPNPYEPEKGNWKSADNTSINITFDEMEAKDSDGKAIWDKSMEYNLLDTRVREQYEGISEAFVKDYAQKGLKGHFVPGTICLPTQEMVTSEGLLKSDEELKKMAKEAGFVEGKPIITVCILGFQAAMASMVLENVYGVGTKMFNGSMTEVIARNPSRITGRVN
uniref:Rhodanese domain-containing protein n=1 Tax=Steinernema glaseri TaxID=37863 RepID=A0A1I8AIM4_9BILA